MAYKCLKSSKKGSRPYKKSNLKQEEEKKNQWYREVFGLKHSAKLWHEKEARTKPIAHNWGFLLEAFSGEILQGVLKTFIQEA